MTRFRRIAALLLCLTLASPASEALAQGCIPDIRQAPAGQVVPLPEALRRAGVSGEVIDAQLCQGGRGFVYRVRVLQPGGKVRRMNIPAN